MAFSLSQIARALNGDVSGNQVRAPGPGHSAEDRSLSVALSNTDDGFIVKSFADDDWKTCKDYVLEKLGLPKFQPNNGGRRNGDVDLAALIQEAIASQRKTSPKAFTVAYDYRDQDGTLLYQVLRYEKPKRFGHRKPDGKGGWIYEGSQKRVVYRWPELLQYPEATVFVCEGEKDANNVAALGYCATTVASGKWTDDCVNALAGRDCWILEDNDDTGRDKALKAAAHLHGVAKTIKIIRLPGLAEGGDISDWLEAGHTKDELEDICYSTPDWEPDSGPPPSSPPPPSPPPPPKPTAKPLCFINIADWLDRDPPPQDWAVLDRFPLRNVSLLSGEGATGKSVLLMQLAAAHVLAKSWLDTLPEPGDALYLSAEDDELVLWRRFVDIVRFHDAPLSELKDHLHLLVQAGGDAVLGAANHNGIVKPTPLFDQLTEAARDIKPKLIVLDTSADIFAGNENDRTQVRQFIGLLRRMAITANSAIIVAFHPSLTGINTGTGMSGSTAWHNSVRARAYLQTVTTKDGDEPDQTLRLLEFRKSNYSALAASITLRWKDGVYIMEPKPGSLEQIAADAKADNVFSAKIIQFSKQGQNMSAKRNAPTYAPTEFAKTPEARAAGIRKADFEAAMQRLLAAGKIRIEPYGPPSRGWTRLVVVDDKRD